MASAEAEAAEAIISRMTLVDWLDDLTVRFLLNLPPAELSSVPRLCFQVEEAQWFYEDFIRPANPSLPSLNLRQFCLTLFQHCPLLSGFNTAQHVAAYEEFLAYKVRVPVRGAILMDDSMDKVLLVRGWKKGASWSFPRGKINKDEKDLDCAIREVYEETGFDIQAAGLVEANEEGDGQVKAIDVIMREQHMKLFVFRGVDLDTHFEPKTRKEISKIQWYNVKDLPGFKKAKGLAGQGQGEAASAKFYMVAPFLGHLKKWIGQQRKKDSIAAQMQHGRSLSTANNGLQAGVTEDEADDTEQGFTTDTALPAVDKSAEELKRLLSIGGPTPTILQRPQEPQTAFDQNATQSNHLLAMLRGNQDQNNSSSTPVTPFEQVDPPFPSTVPETPQPHHPREPSVGVSQGQPFPPQFPYSPQHLQQQHHQAPRHLSGPTHPTSQPPGFNNLPQMQRQVFQQMQHGQRNLPPNFMQQQATGSQFNGHGQQQFGSRFPGASSMQAQRLSQQLPPGLQPLAGQMSNPQAQDANLQGLQHNRVSSVPITSDPAVPEPSKLPKPALNSHHMKLLDAFKSGSKATPSGPAVGSNGQQSGGQQQAALLDLFRKPSAPQPPSQVQPQKPEIVATASVEKEAVAAPASPALTDVTEKPIPRKEAEPIAASALDPRAKSPRGTATPTPQPRAATASQLSRPLGAAFSGNANPKPQNPMQSAVPKDVQLERPTSRGQLFDPANPQKFVRASSQSKPSHKDSLSATMQRQPPSHAPRAAKAPHKPSPKPQPKQSQAEPAQHVPQFSILQRPSSQAGKPPRSSAPQSPLRHEAPAPHFQPQLLKRSSGETVPVVEQRQSSVIHTPAAGEGKKDQLLALFGKAPASQPPPVSSPSHAPAPIAAPLPIASPALTATAPAPQQKPQQKNALLDLFNSNKAEVTIKTPEPPPSPRLIPERKPSSGQAQRPQNSQQHLLNLFTKPSTPSINSPGTPISPFTLGTPAAKDAPLLRQHLPGTTYESDGTRGRLGSMASAVSNGTGSGSGQQTPTEAKDFLLGYLNGVVQKEGYRGSKRS